MTEQTQSSGAEETSVSTSTEEWVHLLASARDSLSDDIVSRLSATVGDSLDLLDRLNRSGLERALPTLTALTASGDLERLAGMMRVLTSAGDALSDDIVNRTAGVCTELLNVADRISRCEALLRLLALLESEAGGRAVAALEQALAEGEATQDGSRGGTASLIRILRSADAQQSLRMLAGFGRAYRSAEPAS